MTEIYRDIAWKLINLRQREGLTQEQLGLKIGLSKFQISRVECGQGEITLENLYILSQYFEIKLEDLFRKTAKMDIEMKLRLTSVEKKHSPSHNQINYVKALENTARIRSIDISSKSIRKMKIEKNFYYDIYVIAGKLTTRTNEDSVEIKKDQVLSVKGLGTLNLVNIYPEPARILTIAY